jgi:O-antigen/teichoic acid export membrane protein
MSGTLAANELENQGAHTLIFSALSVGLGFALTVLITRVYGPGGKGVLDLTAATAGLFSLVLGCSANAGITHISAQQRGLSRKLLVPLVGLGAIAGMLTWSALRLGTAEAEHLGLLPRVDAGFWAGYIAFAVVVSVWSGVLRGSVIGLGGMVFINRAGAVTRLLYVLALLALILGARTESLILLPGHFAVASLVIASVFIAVYFGRLMPRFLAGPAPWPALFAFSLPVHATNILHFLNHRADVFFLSAVRGTDEVGIYTLAVSFSQLILLVSSAFAQPLLPLVSVGTDPAATAMIAARICRLYLVLSTVAAVLLALAVPPLVPLVFGRAFGASTLPLLILLPGVVAFGLVNILISYFAGSGRGSLNFGISVISVVVTLGGNAWLAPKLGAIGAALVSFASYGLAAALSGYFFVRCTGLSAARSFLPRGSDWRTASAAVRRFQP